MPRDHTLTIHPAISIERAALAGAMVAACGECGLGILDQPQRCDAGGRAVGRFILAGITLPPFGTHPQLGIAGCGACGCITVERLMTGACAVTACSASDAEALAAARLLGRRLTHELVQRRVVGVLRAWGYTIVGRCCGATGAVVLRARLPLAHQVLPSARTGHPEFAMEIDAGGIVTLHLAGLHRQGRQIVESTLRCALCEDGPVAVAPTRSQGHAA